MNSPEPGPTSRTRAHHQALGVDPVHPRRHHHVAHHHVRQPRHVLHHEIVRPRIREAELPGDDPGHPAPFDHDPRAALAVLEKLHLGSARAQGHDPSQHARGADHRGLEGHPRLPAAVEGEGPEPGHAVAGHDLGGDRLQGKGLPQGEHARAAGPPPGPDAGVPGAGSPDSGPAPRGARSSGAPAEGRSSRASPR